MLFGIEKKYLRNGGIGGLVGGGFMLIQKITGSMALPYVPLATAGQYLITVGAAPLAEEAFFRMLLLSLLLTVFGLSFWIANAIQAGLFSIYHITAYAGVIETSAILSVSGSFVAAIIFGLLAGYLVKRYGLAASIAAHAVVNFVLLTGGFVIIG